MVKGRKWVSAKLGGQLFDIAGGWGGWLPVAAAGLKAALVASLAAIFPKTLTTRTLLAVPHLRGSDRI